MYLVIQTVDGKVHQNDKRTADELQTEIDHKWETDGEFRRKWVLKPSLDDICDEMETLLKDFKSMSYISLTVEGRTRYFNPANIIYAEVVR